MSLFLTKIHVDVASALLHLPEDSDLESVAWNGKEVELFWSNRRLLTGLTCATEWPIADLAAKKRPASVKDRPAILAPTAPAAPPAPASVKRAPKSKANVPTPPEKVVGTHTYDALRKR